MFYFSQSIQVILLLTNKTIIIALIQYFHYLDIFLSKYNNELLKYIDIKIIYIQCLLSFLLIF